MPHRRISIALISAAALATPISEASATTRYAGPQRFATLPGTAPCTSQTKPCTLLNAIAQAVAGDDVQVADGDYWLSPFVVIGGGGPDPFVDTIEIPADVTLHGADPKDLPVIHVEPNAQAEPGVNVNDGAVIRDIAIAGSAKPNTPISYSLAVFKGTADRVRVQTTGAPGALQIACSLATDSTLRSSLCLGRGTATDGKVTAVSASSPNGSYSIRNVTAITTAVDSEGLNFGTSSGTATANISNSIFRGTANDVRVRAGVTGGNATANIDHSNWVSQSVSAASGASAKLVGLGGNQNAATTVTPLFEDEAAGDFRQKPGSPTIDAGVVDMGNNGPLALGGNNRFIGLTTDIGADEFDPASVVPPTTPQPPTPEPTTPAPTTPGPPAGGAPNTPQTTIVDRQPPALTGLTLGRTVKRSKGTTIRFTLSEPASVALAFGQPKAGRLVTGKCRAQTSKNRKQKRCTIPNVKGTLTVQGKAGTNTFSFKGVLTGGKRLALGSYSVAATPTDAAGNRGTAPSRKFTLKR